MDKTIARSKEHFSSGYGCAESVLLAIAENQGIKSELIPRIASGFCGGMANTNGLCGVVTGAVLALNIVYGRDRADQTKEINYEAIQSFMDSFKAKFGDLNCTALTGCDLGTKEGKLKFEEEKIHQKCTLFVEESTRMVLELI